jgi:N6-L-threonylcarbamoyladenine synthase
MDKSVILAIETSCDETSVAILRDGKELLANIVSTQIETHKQFGGVMPEVASRLHVENITVCIDEAMKKANLNYTDITLIAVTKGPGLIGALHVGLQAAKAISIAYDIPILGVNHMAGHIYANRYVSDFKFPLLTLVVSGGHTQLYLMNKEYEFKCLGETRDDAVGEVYDKVSRVLGLGYPGGPVIDKLASIGENKYELPYPKISDRYAFSFSGLKTAVLNLVNGMKMKNQLFKNEDIACSFQKKVLEILTDKVMMALKEYPVKQVLLAGGVSANRELRKTIVDRVNDKYKNVEVVIPPMWCCTDNAAMLAMAAYYSDESLSALDMGVDPSLNL